MFAPALERNVALAREYAACFDDGGHPYDALLADYDYGLTPARVQAVFDPLARALPPLVAEAAARPAPDRCRGRRCDAQQAAVRGVLRRLGVARTAGASTSRRTRSAWREHQRPAASRRATRATGLESLLAAVHEYGHALYERQIAPELARTNLGHGTSMSMHESQSKLWENHVARNPAFAAVMAAELAAGGVARRPGGGARARSSRCARR